MIPWVILSIAVIPSFRLTLGCSSSIPSRLFWISWPIDLALSESTEANSFAMIPNATAFSDPFNDSETMNVMWYLNHDENFCSSLWSALHLVLPISICFSLDVKCSDVIDVIFSWVAESSWAVWTYWRLIVISLKPLGLAKSPRLLIYLIITYSITRSAIVVLMML